jgi:hypothetical protein
MKLPSLRLQHGLLCALLAALFFAWGAWLMRAPAPAEPLPWLAAWQSKVLPVLARERLSLGELRAAEPSQAEGELWLQSQPGGARLLYRGAFGGTDDAWTLAAVLELAASERDSLVAAAGFQAGSGEQPLSRQLLEQLADLPLGELELTPASALAAERLMATLGQPRVRLQLEDGEAWIYPELGLTARLQDDTLLQLHAAPKRAMQY